MTTDSTDRAGFPNTDSLKLSENDAGTLKQFLERLTGIKDYQNRAIRTLLADRVKAALLLMEGNADICKEAMDYIDEAITSCVDRITLSMKDLAMLELRMDAEKLAMEGGDPRPLRVLGLGVMRRDKLRKIADKHAKTLELEDLIETVLSFQIGVRSRGRYLPGFARDMTFRNFAQVKEELSIRCASLTRLPGFLFVNDDAIIKNCSDLMTLPENCRVGAGCR